MEKNNSFENRFTDLTPVSEGIVIGTAVKLIREIAVDYLPKRQLSKIEVEIETNRILKTSAELIQSEENYLKQQNVVSEIQSISRSYILMIRELTSKIIKEIQDKEINGEYAVLNVLDSFLEKFKKVEDDYLKERVHDFYTIRNRFLSHLMGKDKESSNIRSLDSLDNTKSYILVSDEIMPSDFSFIKKGIISGIIHGKGGKTSHIAIIARSLQIPTIVGAEKILNYINDGDQLILDAYDGIIYTNPEESTLQEYNIKKERKQQKFIHLIEKTKSQPAKTLDNRIIHIMANVDTDSDLEKINAFGAEGIGLYRTEFLFIDNEESRVSLSVLMDEEHQFQIYKKIASFISPKPLVIRTLDIGRNHIKEEKIEKNPFLGLRSIRYCLVNSGIFKTQLRAILRASHYGYVKIMIPMITNLDEIRTIKTLIEEVKRELIIEGVFFDNDIEIGVMVEIPSAALIIDLIAQEVDFIAIGTNDLLQYTLAVDRSSPDLSYLYNPFSVSFVRLLSYLAEKVGNKKIYVCGEIASEALFIILLIGLNITGLSSNVYEIPKMKDLISQLSFTECQAIAQKTLQAKNDEEVKQILLEFYENTIMDRD